MTLILTIPVYLRRLFLVIGLAILMGSCGLYLPPASRVFVIQPFSDMPTGQTNLIYKKMKDISPKTILRNAIPLPLSAYYSQRNRYCADSIINYLDHFGSADTVIIGLTTKDISTTKGKIIDWGVMGLGFQPGNACIVSTYRLSKTNLSDQLFKISLHELGHTQGLPHCKNKFCYMRDAEGGNHLDEETNFCASCRSFLESKGWRF
jgi:archaemetzincin